MVMDRVQRRMAAILVADVVGYSRLMGEDEESTLAILKVYREVIDGLIARHDGRIFGSAGDSIIAEFASPVGAVRCATDIQLEIDKRNADLPELNRMRFRIGINLGDVVVDGDNLMGDGVNIAARLQTLSFPGGICISEAIYAHVRDRLSLEFLDLGEHKVKNIARPLRVYRIPLASEEQVKSPFRGLDFFDFDHAHLFYGRARAIAICTERLEQLAAKGKAFLLIYGMSGAGKSSLLRAGLFPSITRPGAVAGITIWRHCLIRPSEGPDVITSLAAGLFLDGAIPELVEKKTATELANLFRNAPDQALALIREALGKAATTAGSTASQVRLLLAIDQLEELFTPESKLASIEGLVRLLAVLAASGIVWVIGTIRADFFHRCGEIPGFSALKDGLSSYELLPPSGPEIAQIIREPARAAGVRFEESADRGQLEDVLQEAAAADPRSLPLLEFVLDALYEAGRERRLLTFAAYRALGGLEGAIARRADEVIDALSPDIQAALPAVLRALTTVRLGDEAFTTRPATLIEVAGSPTQLALVNALVAARLLVSDENAEGDAVVRVAHEALLSRWPRAREILNASRNFLETRTRLQTDAHRWYAENRNPELLLPAGKRLAEGEELLLSSQGEIDKQIVEYIDASSRAQQEREERDRQAERMRIEAQEAAKRERLEHEAERRGLEAEAATRLAQRTRYAALVALALAAIAGAGAILGFQGQREARRQAVLAENSATQARAAEEKALEARDQALRNQSLSLSFFSQQTAASGDTEAAILLALEALPKNLNAPDRPYLPEAETALYKALSEHRQIRIFHHDGGVTHAAFDLQGDRIVTSSFDKTARIWNAHDGAEIAVLKGHQAVIERAMFSPDGGRILTAAHDSTARIWDAQSGEQIFVLHQPGEVHTALFSPDGTRVITASETGGLTLWDARSGSKIATVPGYITALATFSADGRIFAAGQWFRETSGRTVGMWSSNDGRETRRLQLSSWPNIVVLSPDGSRMLTVASYFAGGGRQGEASYIWDVSNGREIAALRGHKSETHSGTFSHDGRIAATVSIEGTARLWDAATGELRRVLGEETGVTFGDVGVPFRHQDINGAFSPDDRLFATASMYGVVRIWDVESGSLFGALRGHSGLVEHVEFSPDGSRLLTASHDGTARLWDIDGVLTTTLRHRRPPTFASFSPDGVRIVTGGNDSVAHVWDVASGREITRLEARHGGGPLQLATFSPNGRRIAAASRDGRILQWDVESGREAARLEGHDSSVVHVQFSPKGDILLSASADGTARLWDTSSGAEMARLKANGILRKALFNPDGGLILTALNDNTARLWKTDGTEFRVLAGHENRVSAAAFSPDGRLVVTGSLDGTARIWSIKDGSVTATLIGHREPLTEVAFSQDGQSIVTASRDRTARIWNVEDGAERVILRGHTGGVNHAAFSPNGLHVVTVSSQDRTVWLWNAKSGRQIAVLAGQEDAADAELDPISATFTSDGTKIAVVSGDENVRITRVFPTPQDLIDYTHRVVPRQLTPCERRRFFLAVQGDVGDCPS
jgi:WD40 repeat protein/class 3 adenylate cyclase